MQVNVFNPEFDLEKEVQTSLLLNIQKRRKKYDKRRFKTPWNLFSPPRLCSPPKRNRRKYDKTLGFKHYHHDQDGKEVEPGKSQV